MARVLIDGDPLVPLVEEDPRTEVVIERLGSQAQAEHFAETMTGVVVLTRRLDGWAILKPHYDVIVASHGGDALGRAETRLGRGLS